MSTETQPAGNCPVNGTVRPLVERLRDRRGSHISGLYDGEAADEIERLTAALKQANSQAEEFERGWYLRGDALELAIEDLGKATSFASKKARDRHAKTMEVLRAALGPN